MIRGMQRHFFRDCEILEGEHKETEIAIIGRQKIEIEERAGIDTKLICKKCNFRFLGGETPKDEGVSNGWKRKVLCINLPRWTLCGL